MKLESLISLCTEHLFGRRCRISLAFGFLGLFFVLPCTSLTVEKLSWEANFPIDSIVLDQVSGLELPQSYEPERVQKALDNLQTYFQSKNRYFIKLPFPELIPVADSLLELHFSLTEILPSDDIQLRFTGMRYFSEAKLKDLLLISDKQLFSLSDVDRISNMILELCHQRGFLFAQVQLDSLVLDQGLIAWLKVNEGKVFKAQNIHFQGNEHTRDAVLLKLSGLNLSKTITPKELEDANRKLLVAPYIADAMVEPIDETSLLFKIKEGRMTYLEGILGYDGAVKQLSGKIRLKFLNLWGSDRSLALNWQQDKLQKMLELSYHESGPLHFPLEGDIFMSSSSRDTLWTKSIAAAGIQTRIQDHKLGLEFAFTDNLIDASLAKEARKHHRNRSIAAIWQYDSAFPAQNPHKGWQAKAAYRYIHSQNKQWTAAVELDSGIYIPLGQHPVLAIGMHYRDLDDPNANAWDLYQMGGYENLRGYKQAEFSSWRLGFLSWEFRWTIDQYSRIQLFFDHGILAKRDAGNPNNIVYQKDIFAFGFGFKVRTRLGLLGIDYALANREKGLSKLGAGMIHAGLDTSF